MEKKVEDMTAIPHICKKDSPQAKSVAEFVFTQKACKSQQNVHLFTLKCATFSL